MGGLTIKAHELLEEAQRADAVIVGSGSFTRDIVKDSSIMNRIKLDPGQQIIGA